MEATYNGLVWQELQHGGFQRCGLLPGFLSVRDQRSAQQQFDANYVYGGWRPQPGWEYIGRGLAIQYPGDPIFFPVAMTFLRNQLIAVYDAAYVLVADSNTFEVARMD